jgi:hypothetical protein
MRLCSERICGPADSDEVKRVRHDAEQVQASVTAVA